MNKGAGSAGVAAYLEEVLREKGREPFYRLQMVSRVLGWELEGGYWQYPRQGLQRGQLIRQPHLGAALDMQSLKPKSSYALQAYM